LPRPLRFAVDRAAKRVVLTGGVALGQGDFKLVEALLEAYTQDRDANRPAADCRFVRADRLARRMGVDDETLRARVSRTRKSLKRESLKREFLARFGVEPDEHEVIETGNGRGYRLNPHLALVSLGVLAAEEAPPKGDVTAFRADVTTAGG
jgi:hypothetical protein